MVTHPEGIVGVRVFPPDCSYIEALVKTQDDKLFYVHSRKIHANRTFETAVTLDLADGAEI